MACLHPNWFRHLTDEQRAGLESDAELRTRYEAEVSAFLATQQPSGVCWSGIVTPREFNQHAAFEKLVWDLRRERVNAPQVERAA